MKIDDHAMLEALDGSMDGAARRAGYGAAPGYKAALDPALWDDARNVAGLLAKCVDILANDTALPDPQRAAAKACIYHIREASSILELLTRCLYMKAQRSGQEAIEK